MVNRDVLAQEMLRVAEKLFSATTNSLRISFQDWSAVVTNPLFLATFDEARQSQNLISWQESLADIHPIENQLKNYTVLAVDGSQIYPDSHLDGVQCYLLNAGVCIVKYGQKSKATLFSQPRVQVPEGAHEEFSYLAELVDLQREAFEFETLLKQASLLQAHQEDGPLICLIDGSLVFWHLENKSPEIRNKFLSIYLDFLCKCKDLGIVIAGYLSLPKNKELTYLFTMGLCSYEAFSSSGLMNLQKKYCLDVGFQSDVQLVAGFLPENARTTLMISCANIVQAYPAVLKPYFFYLNVGKEIVRIEVPAWIAHDASMVNLITQVCIDQSHKGQGYPVALAEAHEQAVIKGPDRDFFYHLLCKIGRDQQHRVALSQKSLKKRSMAV